MRIITNVAINEKTAIALGNFDGVHLAHTKIIEKTCAYAKKHGLLSCVLLFKSHTDSSAMLLSDEAEKLHILHGLGVDAVYIQEFDDEFMHLSPDAFVDFLEGTLNAAAVCVGYDYRFGYKAEGDAQLLDALCAPRGIKVMVSDEIRLGADTVKSTKIRELIACGDIERANAMLGRGYFVMGEVAHGFENGRKLGTPTANVAYGEKKLLPKSGVYKGYTTVSGKRYRSVINVGSNPTFGADKVTVESHLLGFDGDIYGETVICEFLARLRDEVKFNSIDELKAQLEKDKIAAGTEGDE